MVSDGRIIRGVGGFYYVHTGDGVYECRARGIFRKMGQKPLVGDKVHIEVLDENAKTGNLTEILPRSCELIRPAVANIDEALVVFAGAKPAPDMNLMDRFLVMMESKSIPVAIVINKCDITDEDELAEIVNTYRDIYPVIPISVRENEGIDKIRNLIRHKFTVFAGPSGVGKSSLTNLLVPEASMETGELSRKIDRGKQTTRHTELFYAGDGAYICDTPGFGSVDLFIDDENDLKNYFPEFGKYSGNCRFRGCAHMGEKDCGVKEAVSEGKIAESRYRDYAIFYKELADRRKF